MASCIVKNVNNMIKFLPFWTRKVKTKKGKWETRYLCSYCSASLMRACIQVQIEHFSYVFSLETFNLSILNWIVSENKIKMQKKYKKCFPLFLKTTATKPVIEKPWIGLNSSSYYESVTSRLWELQNGGTSTIPLTHCLPQYTLQVQQAHQKQSRGAWTLFKTTAQG